jgi:hypothetical protein
MRVLNFAIIKITVKLSTPHSSCADKGGRFCRNMGSLRGGYTLLYLLNGAGCRVKIKHSTALNGCVCH